MTETVLLTWFSLYSCQDFLIFFFVSWIESPNFRFPLVLDIFSKGKFEVDYYWDIFNYKHDINLMKTDQPKVSIRRCLLVNSIKHIQTNEILKVNCYMKIHAYNDYIDMCYSDV